MRKKIDYMSVQNKPKMDKNIIKLDNCLKNKKFENSNRDSLTIRNEINNMCMLNLNDVSQISSNVNIELPSLLKEEKHYNKSDDLMKNYIEQSNKENNKNNNIKEEILHNYKVIFLSYYEFFCNVFCKKKKSEKFINFYTFVDCLKSKSSIDAILKSVFGIDLIKKIIFNKEDQEIIEKIEFFSQKFE